MTPVQLQKLNWLISEARGEWNEISRTARSGAEELEREPKNWTGSDSASCTLLDELPGATLRQSSDVDSWQGWQCSYFLGPSIPIWAESRRIAVALAFARWKNLNLEGIV